MTRHTWLLALSIAVLAGVLINWGNQAVGGYSAGTGDHNVLSPLGLQWHDSTKFVNDWFMQSAPQPHWFFDIVTYLGSATGALGVVYALYWMAGLLAFGVATALLARMWTPRTPWTASLVFTLVATQTPWSAIGTGSPLIAQALPAVTGGLVLYLMLALLITRRFGHVAWMAPLVAVLHVQQGAVVIVILAAVLVTQWVRTRRMPWLFLVAIAATGAVVAFGLVLRPIASNLDDFVTVCDTIIPYHCDANSWRWRNVVAYSGFTLLASLTVFFVARRHRPIWVASIGLSAFGVFSAMLVDRFDVPVLGELAQATNVYRLGALLLPFAVWGIILPLFHARWTARYVSFLVVWALALLAYLSQEGWPVADPHGPVFLSLLGLCLIVVMIARRPGTHRRAARVMGGSASVGFGLVFVISAVIAGMITVRPLDTTFIPDDGLREWGVQAEKVIPPGEQVLVNPLSTGMRLAFGRGVVVDCKNVPYGGKPWAQWMERMNDLGGTEQCVQSDLSRFQTLSAEQLDALASKYDADYMALDSFIVADRMAGFEALGWEVVLPSSEPLEVVVLGRR